LAQKNIFEKKNSDKKSKKFVEKLENPEGLAKFPAH